MKLDLMKQACGQGEGESHVGGVGVGLGHVAHENAVHSGGVNFAIGKGGFGGLNSQVRAGEILELAAECAEGGALCAHDKNCSLLKTRHKGSNDLSRQH